MNELIFLTIHVNGAVKGIHILERPIRCFD